MWSSTSRRKPRTKEDVLDVLSRMASNFRTGVGESLASVEQHSTPLAEVTTPSLEALKAYSTAWKLDLSSGAAAAAPLFKRAVEIDPEFAMAHAHAGDRLQQSRRVGAVDGEHDQGLSVARSGQ